MRALAIDPVMCSRDGTDTTVELTFVQLKKARLNRNRIGRMNGTADPRAPMFRATVAHSDQTHP